MKGTDELVNSQIDGEIQVKPAFRKPKISGVLFAISMCGVIMPRSTELFKTLRKKVVDARGSGKGNI